MIRNRFALVALVVLLVAGTAFAWNPHRIYKGRPMIWDDSQPIVWNPDGGPLGKLSNAEANVWVRDCFDVWEAVPTATLAFSQGGQIVDPATGSPTDVTSANYDRVTSENNGQNPIIYDNDRDIFDMLGIASNILGFGGSLLADTQTGQLVKGYAVLQGDYYDDEPAGTPPSDPGEKTAEEFRGVMVHEFGHFSGVGHSEVNRGLDGLGSCPAPGDETFSTMHPFFHDGVFTLAYDDEIGLSSLYPSAAFQSNYSAIQGVLWGRDGVTPFDGANIVLRPDTADCGRLYSEAIAMQAGCSPVEHGGAGSYRFMGRTPGADYTLFVTLIRMGGSYQVPYPEELGSPDEYYNGGNEAWFDPPDDPTARTAITAPAGGTAVENVDIKLNNSGLPAEVEDSLRLELYDGETPVDPLAFAIDDGGVESAWGYASTHQMAIVNRFSPSPSQLPLQIERIDIMWWHETVQPGRAVRLLIYADPDATGDMGNASLVHTEDTSVQKITHLEFNEFTLATPYYHEQGDLYIGVYDLVADPQDTYFGSYDSTTPQGRSFIAGNSTAPGAFSLESDKNWMIRAHGHWMPGPGTMKLTWGEACNEGTVTDQDYAVYEGSLAQVSSGADLEPLVCRTGREHVYTVRDPVDRHYWLVAPVLATKEGSLGTTSEGAERAAASRCGEVDPEPCP